MIGLAVGVWLICAAFWAAGVEMRRDKREQDEKLTREIVRGYRVESLQEWQQVFRRFVEAWERAAVTIREATFALTGWQQAYYMGWLQYQDVDAQVRGANPSEMLWVMRYKLGVMTPPGSGQVMTTYRESESYIAGQYRPSTPHRLEVSDDPLGENSGYIGNAEGPGVCTCDQCEMDADLGREVRFPDEGEWVSSNDSSHIQPDELDYEARYLLDRCWRCEDEWVDREDPVGLCPGCRVQLRALEQGD